MDKERKPFTMKVFLTQEEMNEIKILAIRQNRKLGELVSEIIQQKVQEIKNA